MNEIIENAKRILEHVADSIVLDQMDQKNLLDNIRKAMVLLEKGMQTQQLADGYYIKSGYLESIDIVAREIDPIFRVLIESME